MQFFGISGFQEFKKLLKINLKKNYRSITQSFISSAFGVYPVYPKKIAF
jgi:hypothetical protein